MKIIRERSSRNNIQIKPNSNSACAFVIGTGFPSCILPVEPPKGPYTNSIKNRNEK